MSTVRLHRVLRATPDKIYRAFLDADAMVKWLPPNGFTGKVHHLDAKVDGTYKMSFTNFATGQSHSFGGEYLELQTLAGRKIVVGDARSHWNAQCVVFFRAIQDDLGNAPFPIHLEKDLAFVDQRTLFVVLLDDVA